ncbi:MAG: heme-binding domain-containing protein [Ginsengibacter sp.]
MKKALSIFGVLLIVAFIFIQFMRPSPNAFPITVADNITSKYFVSDEVQNILKISCNDCHSNKTIYPWYSKVQPIAWFLDDHITDGKRHLNFDEFATYSLSKQYNRFKKISQMVHDGEMPIYSYTLIHWNAKLDNGQRTIIENWASDGINQLEKLYPFDSLHVKNVF